MHSYHLQAVDDLPDSDPSRAQQVEALRHLLAVTILLVLSIAAFCFAIEFASKERPLESEGIGNVIDQFASWQDWGGQNQVAQNLHQALELERRAWEMTRQTTCSSEAGDSPPQSIVWKGWPEAGDRCHKLKALHLRQFRKPTGSSSCWDILTSSCASLDKCGATWQEAHKAALQQLKLTVHEPAYPLDDVSLCGQRSGISRSWTSDETKKAHSWFERNVQVYVLEMPGLVLSSKYETVFNLTQHGLQAMHVAGFDLLSSSDLEAARFARIVPDTFNESLIRDQAYAVSKAASHFHIQNLVSVAQKPIALVLEDGVELSSDFQEKVWSLIQEEIPCDWDVLSLSTSCPAGRCVSPHLARIGPNPGRRRNERCEERISRGFGGILYRSAAVAEIRNKWMEVAFDASHPSCLDLDASLMALSDEVAFYAVPAVQTPRILTC